MDTIGAATFLMISWVHKAKAPNCETKQKYDNFWVLEYWRKALLSLIFGSLVDVTFSTHPPHLVLTVEQTRYSIEPLNSYYIIEWKQ